MTYYEEAKLPKLWLERIQEFWDKTVPTDFPKTSSEFSLSFDKEDKEIVSLMESKLGTEESVITTEMIPENNILGGYLGTYDVTGVTGELVLLSPEKVPTSAVDIIAMHYNKETSTWEKIEDAHVIDGYVYGTMSSFSPIAIFTVKRDSYYVELSAAFGKPIYVANGIPVTVFVNEEGATVVKDANGKETVIDVTSTIIGGSIDGSNIESTSVYVKGASINSIFGGSFSEENIAVVDKASVIVEDSNIAKGIVGSSYMNRINNLSISVKNTKANFVSAGESNWTLKKKDSNKENPNYASNAWVKNAIINIENSDIYIVYSGGNNGYLFVDHEELNVDGGKYGYFTTAGSNGATGDCICNTKNAEIEVFQTTNRGTVGNVKATLKDCKVNVCAVTGDPTDKTVTGTIENVKLDITGGNVNLYAGTNAGKAIDSVSAKEIISFVKIGRQTTVDYKNGTKAILGDLIRLK